MKRFLTLTSVLACFFATVSTAQERTRSQNAQPPVGATERLDDKTRGSAIRVSELQGMNLKNLQGENVGKIHDLVLDVNGRTVQYAAVTYGGFLGIGNKLFAVPFEAFQVGTEKGEPVMILDVSEEQLKSAEGFDDDNWPNFADPDYTNRVAELYSIDRSDRPGRQRTSGSNQSPSAEGQLIFRANKLIGTNLQNSQREQVGEIYDLVVDIQKGDLRYAAVTYGGFLGFGNKLFAVPMEAFQYQPHAERRGEYVIVLNVTEDQLDRSEGFDQDNWPDFNDDSLVRTLDRRYGVERDRGNLTAPR